MPKRKATLKKKIATFTHDEAGRLNIPTAEKVINHLDDEVMKVYEVV